MRNRAKLPVAASSTSSGISLGGALPLSDRNLKIAAAAAGDRRTASSPNTLATRFFRVWTLHSSGEGVADAERNT
eukprot:5958248-Prymnesium_polylepis.2